MTETNEPIEVEGIAEGDEATPVLPDPKHFQDNKGDDE